MRKLLFFILLISLPGFVSTENLAELYKRADNFRVSMTAYTRIKYLPLTLFRQATTFGT